MMRIYCPELLEDFEKATKERSEWVLENRKQILSHVKKGEPPTLAEAIAMEAVRTASNISALREQLATFIVSRYPLGDVTSD